MFSFLKSYSKILNNNSTENFFFSSNDNSIYFADINNKFLYLAKLVITFLEFESSYSNNEFNNSINFSSYLEEK